MERPITVAALTQRITASLEGIGSILVQGELSQAKVHTSGHFYATLRDREAVVGLVMWRSTVVRNHPLPPEGSLVVVRGQLSVYAPRGQYQIIASRISPLGRGDLAARFEELKARLTAEGLFDEERKRPLPSLPRAVGIATAPGSAALADILHGLRARFPQMPIVHAHCRVQGDGAAGTIVCALQRLCAHPDVDVVICGRGGGSLEDLWAFNEEAVVRAIASCPKPVISAVGHETDTTLADLAADLRAKTPTAAAELAVPLRADIDERIAGLRADLDATLDGMLAGARDRIAALAAHRALAGPGYQVEMRRQRLDELGLRLDEALDARVDERRRQATVARARFAAADPRRVLAHAAGRAGELRRALALAAGHAQRRGEDRLAALAGRLDALSPLAVLARGYAVVRTPDGRVVRAMADAPPGSLIAARVADGWLDAVVQSQRRQRLNEPETPYEG